MAIASIRDEYLAKYRHDRFKAALALALSFGADDPETLKKGYDSEPSLIATDKVFDLTDDETLAVGSALGIEVGRLDHYIAHRGEDRRGT